MEPIEAITPAKDTSLALMLAAQKRGFALHYMGRNDIHMRCERVYAHTRDITVKDDAHQWFKLGAPVLRDMEELDVLLMRADPPFDMSYIFTTYLLEYAQQHHGLKVINNPVSLRNHNEKLFTADFPDCCPPLLVSAQAEELRAFIGTHKDVILKPLDGMGGQSIFRVQSHGLNIGVILETMLTKNLPVMAQKYLPEIKQSGDKRLILIEGEPIGHALARFPAEGETRANLAAGGSGKVHALTKRDREICAQVGRRAKELGLLFVGLDVIGDYLTEINITSPTGVREIERATSEDISGQIVDAVARQAQITH